MERSQGSSYKLWAVVLGFISQGSPEKRNHYLFIYVKELAHMVWELASLNLEGPAGNSGRISM